MSIFGKIGSGIKHAAQGVGHAVGKVASNPWVQGLTAAGLAATGVGAPAAAAIMAGVKGGGALLKPGGNIGQGLKGAATGAVMGAGAAKAGQLLRGGGSLGGILGKAGSALKATGGFAGGAPGAGGTGGAGGAGGMDIMKLLGLGAAGVAGVQGYTDSRKAGAAQDAALAANTGIAGQLQQHGSELLAGAAPIRNAAQTAMTASLAKGRRTTPLLPAPRSPLALGPGPAIPPPPGAAPAAPAIPAPPAGGGLTQALASRHDAPGALPGGIAGLLRKLQAGQGVPT
ncbi:MAG: hypothetical protein ACJ768_19615 [Gaiellaceae bacterium]